MADQVLAVLFRHADVIRRLGFALISIIIHDVHGDQIDASERRREHRGWLAESRHHQARGFC